MAKKKLKGSISGGSTSDNSSLNDSLRGSCKHILPCGVCKLTGKQCGKLYIPYVPNYPEYPIYPGYPNYPTYPNYPNPIEPLDPIKPTVTWKYFPELEPKAGDSTPNIYNQFTCKSNSHYTTYSKKKK